MVGRTFDVLDKKEIRLYSAETQSFETYSCVPKFVHDNCNAVSMVLSEDAPKKPQPFQNLRKGFDDNETHFRSVDLPAPRNPEIIVRGT